MLKAWAGLVTMTPVQNFHFERVNFHETRFVMYVPYYTLSPFIFSALSWRRILCFTKLESSSFVATFTDQIIELQCLDQGFEARTSKNVVYIVCHKSEALEGDLEFIKVGDTVSITISVLPQISVNFSLKVFELDKELSLLLLNNIAKVFPRNVCFLNDMIDDRENTEFLKAHDIRVLCDSLQG